MKFQIILKEREEKRLLREQQLQLVANTNSVDSSSSLLPLGEPAAKDEHVSIIKN